MRNKNNYTNDDVWYRARLEPGFLWSDRYRCGCRHVVVGLVANGSISGIGKCVAEFVVEEVVTPFLLEEIRDKDIRIGKRV